MILHPVVHIPTLYANPLQGSRLAEELYCDVVLGLLQDAEANCVLLVDEDGKIRNEIDAALDRWPQKHRMKAKERLKKLASPTRPRIIEVPPGTYTPDASCGTDGCRHAVGIAEAVPYLAAVFGPPECACRAVCTVNSIPLSRYKLSAPASSRRGPEGLELPDRAWDKARFEAEVWKPLFRYAKHVKVIDRLIGRQFDDTLRALRDWSNRTTSLQRAGLGLYGQPPPPVIMGRNFARSLEWIFGEFVRHSQPGASRTFEVVCALDANHWSPQELSLAAEALRSFASDLSDAHGLTMTMTVKLEQQKHLRHARVLFTDQVKLLIERGHDLLHDDGVSIRDVMIKHVADADVIEREVNSLADAP